ncbi:hypothetical protein ACKAV7_007070 [Fusarium commune]
MLFPIDSRPSILPVVDVSPPQPRLARDHQRGCHIDKYNVALRRQHRTDLVALRQRLGSENQEVALYRYRHAPNKRRMEYISNDSSPPPAGADPPPFLCDSFSRHRSRPRLCSRTATPLRTQPDDTIDSNTRSSIRLDTLDLHPLAKISGSGGFTSEELGFTGKIAFIQLELFEDGRWPA